MKLNKSLSPEDFLYDLWILVADGEYRKALRKAELLDSVLNTLWENKEFLNLNRIYYILSCKRQIKKLVNSL